MCSISFAHSCVCYIASVACAVAYFTPPIDAHHTDSVYSIHDSFRYPHSTTAFKDTLARYDSPYCFTTEYGKAMMDSWRDNTTQLCTANLYSSLTAHAHVHERSTTTPLPHYLFSFTNLTFHPDAVRHKHSAHTLPLFSLPCEPVAVYERASNGLSFTNTLKPQWFVQQDVPKWLFPSVDFIPPSRYVHHEPYQTLWPDTFFDETTQKHLPIYDILGTYCYTLLACATVELRCRASAVILCFRCVVCTWCAPLPAP